MILTEEEAKMKRCNNPSRDDYRCDASDCMHWRWAEGKYEYVGTNTLQKNEDGEIAPSGEPPMPDGKGWEEYDRYETSYGRNWKHGNSLSIEWRREKPNRYGYCGLSGRPEFDK